jgi:hypothetical protein
MLCRFAHGPCPVPAFASFLCFQAHLRMHLHFLKSGVRSLELGVRMAAPAARAFRLRTSRFGLCSLFSCTFRLGTSQSSRTVPLAMAKYLVWTPDSGLASFVFMHIPAWNVVFWRSAPNHTFSHPLV